VAAVEVGQAVSKTAQLVVLLEVIDKITVQIHAQRARLDKAMMAVYQLELVFQVQVQVPVEVPVQLVVMALTLHLFIPVVMVG
jgi:hypothetical protein